MSRFTPIRLLRTLRPHNLPRKRPSLNLKCRPGPSSSFDSVCFPRNLCTGGEKPLTPEEKLQKDVAEYYSQYEDEYYEVDEDAEWVVPEEETFPISLERGKHGVFDPEELVEFLKSERGLNICCISVPKEAVYADYLIICTAFSHRHLVSLAERTNKLYKRKKRNQDRDAYLEGRKDPQWRVLDMGNIVLHIMTEDTRFKYDIEQLWACGPDLDDLSVEKEAQQGTNWKPETKLKANS